MKKTEQTSRTGTGGFAESEGKPRQRGAARRYAPLGGAVLVHCLLTASSIWSHAADLLYESNFSAPSASWRVAAPKSQKKHGCSIEAAPGAGHSGQDALRTVSRDFATYFVVLKDPVPVEPKRLYRVTAWLCAEADASARDSAFLRLRFTAGGEGKNAAEAGSFYVSDDSRVTGGSAADDEEDGEAEPWTKLLSRVSKTLGEDDGAPEKWTKIEAVVEAPAESESLDLSLVVHHVRGGLLWDGIQLEDVTGEAKPTPLTEPPKPAASFDWNQISDADMFAKLDLDLPGMGEVKTLVAKGDFPNAKTALLAWCREKNPPLQPEPPKDGSKTDPDAEEVYNHMIRNTRYVFNPPIPPAFMGKDFDWTYNPVPKDSPNFARGWTSGVIGRMGFWSDLAQGYRKTGNEKYAAKWAWFVRDFARDNPMEDPNAGPGDSVLWRTLDTALRINASWPSAYFTFLHSPSFSSEDNWLFLKLVYAHAVRLKAVQENFPQRVNNWSSFECRGLYVAGALFPEFRDAPGWRKLAVDRLMKIMATSLTPEGLQAELSPGYHRAALSSLRRVFDLGRSHGHPLPPDFQEKLLAMHRALVLIMNQAGQPVCTNDSAPVDAREIAKEGLEIASDPLLAWAASEGKEGTAPPDSTAIEHAGFYAMRSGWGPGEIFLFFRGGPVGIGHCEQDMLQIVLEAWGKTLLFDPGKYAYDQSEWRRFAINTPSHNTVIVDGKWQFRRHSKPPMNQPPDKPWVTTPFFDFVSATYDNGYRENTYDPTVPYHPEHWSEEADLSVAHTRRVLFLKPWYALVLDSLDGTGQHTFDAHFHMDAPAARLDPETQAVFSERPDGIQVALYPLDRQNLLTEIVQGQKNPLLGWMPSEHRPIPTARFRKVQAAPATFATFLYPFRGDPPSFSAEPLEIRSSAGNRWGFALRSPQESAEIAVLGKRDTARDLAFRSSLVGEVATKASGLILRQFNGKGEFLGGGWDLSDYRDDRLAFSTSAPAALNFARDPNGAKLFLLNTGTDSVDIAVSRPFARKATLQPGKWIMLSAAGVEPLPQSPVFLPSLAKGQ